MKMCNFWAKAERWDDKYSKAMVRAVELYEDPDDLVQTIEKFLGKKSRGAFRTTNPYSKQLWLRSLIKTFIKFHIRQHPDGDSHIKHFSDCFDDPLVACAMVTFTHREWVFCDRNIQFDLEKAKQKVRNALVGCNHISTFEVAYYTNENWITDGIEGRLVSFHCHSLVWFKNRSQLSRRRTKIKPRFIPILGNKFGVHFKILKKMKDAIKIIRYQSKLPFYGKRTVVKANGRKKQENAKLSYKSHHSLFRALKPYSIFDFWLAGGEGAKILKKAHSKVLKECPSYKGDIGPEDDDYETPKPSRQRRARGRPSFSVLLERESKRKTSGII